MTDIMTHDSNDLITMSTDGANLDNIEDQETLQRLLEESEDLEFRRLVRAKLRKLKKGKHDSEPITKPTKACTPEQRFIPQTNGGDAKLVSSNLRKTSVSSVKSHATDSNLGKLPENVKLRSTSISKTKDDSKNKINQAEEVVLRSTPPNSTPPTSVDKKGKTAYDVMLKPVSMTISGTGSQLSGVPRRGNPTPRQALKHFKEMDNEALLRHTGTRDPQEALKRISRNLTPNNIRDQTLNWCKNRLYSYQNVNIEDFSTSWSDGLAFCALANSFFPEAFDYDTLTADDRGFNFKLAFDMLESKAGVVPLLEVEDMTSTRHPDWKCVFTYVNSIIARMSEIRREREGTRDSNDVIDNNKDRSVAGGDDDDDDKF